MQKPDDPEHDEPASAQDSTDFCKKRFTPNPTVAALLSAAIPGAGQVYSRAWWHVPIFVASEGYCLWRAYDASILADSLWDIRESLEPGSSEYTQAQTDFENATNDRNTYLWIFAGAKFLDIVDAYICAHLFDFDDRIDAPLSVNITPLPDGVKLTLDIRF